MYVLNNRDSYANESLSLSIPFYSHHDLDSMFGRLKLNENVQLSASDNILSLTGSQGIWQSSIVLELPDGRRACSTLKVNFLNPFTYNISLFSFFNVFLLML